MDTMKSRLMSAGRLVAKVSLAPARKGKDLKELFGQRMEFRGFSESSERLQPHVVLHTISEEGLWFKLAPEEGCEASWHELDLIHTSCVTDSKTAIVSIGGGLEVHLLAMLGKRHKEQRKNHRPYFWGFLVKEGQFAACMKMLNLRCLAVVFDLDETLFVANTMKSFEDKIAVLRQRLAAISDPQIAKLLASELGRYEEDRQILLQYYETNAVMLDGKCYVAEPETVTPLDGESLPAARPVLRLPHRNIILTRIFPENRDTSVLVRMRPSWDDLRSYFSVKGRKRFEAFVCTMAEKQYALEMWRLLDPDGKLIHPKELAARIISVKAGTLKSLQRVFHRNDCDPRMAVVIDDRINVWEERDQPRVHLVQAFAPYAAPLAEVNLPVPVLVHARNIICHIRTDFYRAVDDFLCQELPNTCHDVELHQLPPIPDTAIFVKGAPVDNDVIESKEQQQWIFQYPGEKPLVQQGVELDVPGRGAPRFGGPHLESVQPIVNQPRAPPFPSAVDQPPDLEEDSEDLPVWQPDILAEAPAGAPAGIDKAVPAQPEAEEEVEEGELSDREDSDSQGHAEADTEQPKEGDSEKDLELERRRRLLILQHGMDPVLVPHDSSLPPGFNLPISANSPVLLPQSLTPHVPPLSDLAKGPVQVAVPLVLVTSSPRPSLRWEVKAVVESGRAKAASGEGAIEQDDNPAVSRPDLGPPGFSILNSSAHVPAVPVMPSLKRMASFVSSMRQAPISDFSIILDAVGAKAGAIVEYRHVAIGERESPIFHTTVLVDGQGIAEAQGANQNVSQQLASERALHLLGAGAASSSNAFEGRSVDSAGRARGDGDARTSDGNLQVMRSLSGRVVSNQYVTRNDHLSDPNQREAGVITFSSEMSSLQGAAKRQRLMGPS